MMRRPYFIRDDVQFGTETEGYNPDSNTFDSYHKLRGVLGPAFEKAGIPFTISGKKHFYSRWDMSTETTIQVGTEQWIGYELKSRILQGAEGLQELRDAHAVLERETRLPDGGHSFVANETCSFQLHVSPIQERSEFDGDEPRIAGTYTETQIRNLAHAIAINETAYKSFLENHRLESKFCKIYTSTEIPDGCTIADILDPTKMTIQQVTGNAVGSAMISLANLNVQRHMEIESQREPEDGPPPPRIYTVQFRAKEGVTLPDFDGHAYYAAVMVNFVSLALNKPHITLEEAERLTLHGPSNGKNATFSQRGPVIA